MKYFVTLCLLLSVGVATAQSPNQPAFSPFLRMNWKKEIVPTASLFFAGACDGLGDVLAHRPNTFLAAHPNASERFWGEDSWMNKYKDFPHDTSPAFPGAKTWLVGTTDGWHLAKGTRLKFTALAIVTAPLTKIETYHKRGQGWKIFILRTALYSTAFYGGQFLVYNVLYPAQ